MLFLLICSTVYRPRSHPWKVVLFTHVIWKVISPTRNDGLSPLLLHVDVLVRATRSWKRADNVMFPVSVVTSSISHLPMSHHDVGFCTIHTLYSYQCTHHGCRDMAALQTILKDTHKLSAATCTCPKFTLASLPSFHYRPTWCSW